MYIADDRFVLYYTARYGIRPEEGRCDIGAIINCRSNRCRRGRTISRAFCREGATNNSDIATKVRVVEIITGAQAQNAINRKVNSIHGQAWHSLQLIDQLYTCVTGLQRNTNSIVITDLNIKKRIVGKHRRAGIIAKTQKVQAVLTNSCGAEI